MQVAAIIESCNFIKSLGEPAIDFIDHLIAGFFGAE